MRDSSRLKPLPLFPLVFTSAFACGPAPTESRTPPAAESRPDVCAGPTGCPGRSSPLVSPAPHRRRFVDLALHPADGTLLGRTENRGLGSVATGDLGGDGTLETCVGGIDNVVVEGRARPTAGRVSCYPSASLIDGLDAIVPEGAAIDIVGASPSDRLGGSGSGHLFIGDVTGDGRADLVVSATLGDGPDELRSNAGEIYVLRGGTAAFNGPIDLAAPPEGVVGAVIFGRSPEDRLRVVRLGDVTGDGVLDLIAGAPGDDTQGEDTGALYVFEGGAGLEAGEHIDLSLREPFAELRGTTPGAYFGEVAVVGDVFGGPGADLVVGNGGQSFEARERTGAVWIFEGPLAPGLHDVEAEHGVRIVGATSNDNFGTALTIASFYGPNARPALAVGAPQTRLPSGVQVGSVDVFRGPIAAPASRTIDLLTTAPTTRLLGVDEGDQTGSSLAAGDFDGDGIEDLAIAASSADGAGNRRDGAGELMVVLGRTRPNALVELRHRIYALWVHGAGSRDLLGAHGNNLTVQDLDGDGKADVCVGAYRGGELREGRIDCFRGE